VFNLGGDALGLVCLGKCRTELPKGEQSMSQGIPGEGLSRERIDLARQAQSL
jgi:hypothetical protein